MTHFCKCGGDQYTCQECGLIQCSLEQPSRWIEIKRTGREGNVCPRCVKAEAGDILDYLKIVHKRGGGVAPHTFQRLGALLND